jgi:hypothetical protein
MRTRQSALGKKQPRYVGGADCPLCTKLIQTSQASKRAAASFFFELLVLGTRDCVKLEQPERYGDISVQAKPKLFDGIAVVKATQAVNA